MFVKFRPFITIFLLFLLTSCFFSDQDTILDEQDAQNQESKNKTTLSSSLKINAEGLSFSKGILKTVHGNIVFKFYPKKAPNTVTRVIQLIQSGFYDGLLFHRVVDNYLIQTGDPSGGGRGGSGIKLKAEFNDIPHIKGTIAMARDPELPDSSDSQFYVSLTTLPHLDSKFIVFAQVIEGFSVLDKIVKGDKILSLSFQK